MRPFPSGWARRGSVSGSATGFGWASAGMATAMRWKSRCPILFSGSGSAVTTPTACSRRPRRCWAGRCGCRFRSVTKPSRPWVTWSSPGRIRRARIRAAATGSHHGSHTGQPQGPPVLPQPVAERPRAFLPVRAGSPAENGSAAAAQTDARHVLGEHRCRFIRRRAGAGPAIAAARGFRDGTRQPPRPRRGERDGPVGRHVRSTRW